MLSTPAVANGYYETMTGRHELTTFLRNNFHNPKRVTPELVNRLYENAKKKGAIHPYASLITGYLDSHLLSSLPKVQNPILLVWGRHARPTPVEHSVRLTAVARDSRRVRLTRRATVPRFRARVASSRVPSSRPSAT